MISWLSHVAGLDNPSGAWYLFHSGFAGYFGYLAVVGAVWRAHLCEVTGCHRFARKHRTAAGHHACRKHHPEDELTAEHVHREHWLHRR